VGGLARRGKGDLDWGDKRKKREGKEKRSCRPDSPIPSPRLLRTGERGGMKKESNESRQEGKGKKRKDHPGPRSPSPPGGYPAPGKNKKKKKKGDIPQKRLEVERKRGGGKKGRIDAGSALILSGGGGPI